MLKAMSMANPHGCGFASTRHSCKSLDFGYFYNELLKVEKDEACIIHFRYATQGAVNLSNCHPFRFGDVYFAHNGTLDIEPISDKTDSETAFLTEIVPCLKYGLHSKKLRQCVGNIIGRSRFAFLKGTDIVRFGLWQKFWGYEVSNTNFEYCFNWYFFDKKKLDSYFM